MMSWCWIRHRWVYFGRTERYCPRCGRAQRVVFYCNNVYGYVKLSWKYDKFCK